MVFILDVSHRHSEYWSQLVVLFREDMEPLGGEV